MFLNKTQFKKWIKEAYNHSGLTVGMVHGGLVLQGHAWIVWIDEGHIPNWVKAAVMEHTGILPDSGDMFRAVKDEPIQYEITKNIFFDLPGTFIDAKVPFTVTPIIYDAGWNTNRLFQVNETKSLIPVNEALYGIIDFKELEGENPPVGPSALTYDGSLLMWKNENSALAICKAASLSDTGNKTMELLTKINYGEA